VSARDVIETLAILLAAGVVAELVADLLRLPRMVLLLGAGVLLGPTCWACSSFRSNPWASSSS
jgi:Kef-type K+ transport system membrane component KefB